MKKLISALFSVALIALSQTSVADANADKVWTHPGTGLMWARCLVGAWSYVDICQDQRNGKEDYTWYEAVAAADEIELAGYTDWRLPTAEEVYSLLECRYSESENLGPENLRQVQEWRAAGEFEARGLPDGCLSASHIRTPPEVNGGSGLNKVFTASFDFDYPNPTDKESINRFIRKTKLGVDDPASTKAIPSVPSNFNPSKAGGVLVWIDHRAAISDKNYFKARLLLVRGGNGKNRFDAVVQRAKAEQDPTIAQRQEAMEYQRATAQVEKQRQDNLKNVAETKRLKAEYIQKTAVLRKNVKPGDKLTNGMVIAVKGDLVQIQVMKKECVDYSASINSFSHKRDCLRYTVVPNGTAWVNRNEILPAE